MRMHKEFGEWYRLVSLVPESDKLPLRWAGVEKWVSQIQADDDAILETVRIFQGLPEKDSRDKFIAAFQDRDSAFHRRNLMEFRVLAGASLVECMCQAANNEEDARLTRAATIIGTALEASKIFALDAELSEVLEAVRTGLYTLARELRVRWVVDSNKVQEQSGAAAEAVQNVADAATWELFKAAVPGVFDALIEAANSSGASLAAVEHNLRCADEENDILWWLEGGCSRDLNTPWSTLKDATPLIAAWELADLTDVALGPQDAAAFLDRIVSAASIEARALPLPAYVNALPIDWAKRKATLVGEKGLDLAPLVLALTQRAMSDASSWQQFFESTSGLKSTTLYTPEQVARQGYVEAMMLRTLAKTEE